MKTFLTDVLILASISGVVACVMFLPQKTTCRLEKHKGVVIYDAPVTKEQATKVLDTLVETGTANGQKEQTHILQYVTEDGEETMVWSMTVESNYFTVLSDFLLRDAAMQLHSMIYSNNRALVEIQEEIVADNDETQQISTDWGSVLYDSPIEQQAAKRVAQIITQMGGYNGAIYMHSEGDHVNYKIQRDPASLANVRELAASEMKELVLKAFPEERVRVMLVDKHLQPLKDESGELLAPLLEAKAEPTKTKDLEVIPLP